MTNAAFAETPEVSGIPASWARELEAWRSIPPQSPVWDDLEGFYAALRRLGAEKLAERNAAREALRSALDELCAQFSADLEYFEATSFAWQADAVAWDEAELVAARVTRLRDELQSRRDLKSQSSGNYSEMRRLREQVYAIEDAIAGHLSALTETFRSVAVFDVPVQTDPPVEPELAVVRDEVPEEAAGVESQHPADEPSEAVEFQLIEEEPILGEPAADAASLSVTDFAPVEPVFGTAEPPHELAVDRAAFSGANSTAMAHASEAPILPDFEPFPFAAEAPAAPSAVADDAPSCFSSAFADITEPEVAVDAEPPTETVVLPLTGLPLPPPVSRSVRTQPGDDLHRYIGSAHATYSPLSRGQERLLLGDASGVALVYASGGMGFEQLPEAVTDLVETAYDGRAVCAMIPPGMTEGEELYAWLETFSSGNDGSDCLAAFQPVVMCADSFAGRIEAALRFCEDHASRSIRVLFLMAPGAIWSWLSFRGEEHAEIAGRLEPTVTLKPWDREAVQDRLEREGRFCDAGMADLVLDATGGWSWCLDRLFERAGDDPDMQMAIGRFMDQVFTGDLREEVLMRTGVRPETLPHAVMGLLQAEGEVPLQRISPDLFDEEVTLVDCRAAVEYLTILSCAEAESDRLRLALFLQRVLRGEG